MTSHTDTTVRDRYQAAIDQIAAAMTESRALLPQLIEERGLNHPLLKQGWPRSPIPANVDNSSITVDVHEPEPDQVNYSPFYRGAEIMPTQLYAEVYSEHNAAVRAEFMFSYKTERYTHDDMNVPLPLADRAGLVFGWFGQRDGRSGLIADQPDIDLTALASLLPDAEAVILTTRVRQARGFEVTRDIGYVAVPVERLGAYAEALHAAAADGTIKPW